MSKFEDHLWREVVRAHGADLAQMSSPATRNNWRARPRLIVGTSIGLAGAGTALAIAFSATTTPPAFAVTRNHDGTVTVTVTASSGVAGANAKLHQLGIRAKVMAQVPSGCAMHGSPAPSPGITADRWTINPRKIPAGQTLMLTLARHCHTTKGPEHGSPSPSPS
jgi:hypothetical protein